MRVSAPLGAVRPNPEFSPPSFPRKNVTLAEAGAGIQRVADAVNARLSLLTPLSSL